MITMMTTMIIVSWRMHRSAFTDRLKKLQFMMMMVVVMIKYNVDNDNDVDSSIISGYEFGFL